MLPQATRDRLTLTRGWQPEPHFDCTEFAEDCVLIRTRQAAPPSASRPALGEGGYRMLVAEAGHIAPNLILAATALGASARWFGGVFDDLLNHDRGWSRSRSICWRCRSGTRPRWGEESP
jgi:nitroreductase